MTNCCFTKLVTWKDPNLSAAVLTIGNAIVLLGLFATDPLAWAQFALVWGVLPLGLVVRVAGLEKYFGTRSIVAVSQNVLHHVELSSSASLIKAAIYLLILSRFVDLVGFALALGIIGNALMIAPLVWELYAKSMVDHVSAFSLSPVKRTVKEGYEKIASLGTFAPAIFGGLNTFIFILFVSNLCSSLLGYLLSIAGYSLLLCGAFDINIEFESKMTFLKKFETSEYFEITRKIILWDNYPKSIATFVALYAFYFVAAFTGTGLLVAAIAGSAVAMHLVPSVLKEKASIEIQKRVETISGKILKKAHLKSEDVAKATVKTTETVDYPDEADSAEAVVVAEDIEEAADATESKVEAT